MRLSLVCSRYRLRIYSLGFFADIFEPLRDYLNLESPINGAEMQNVMDTA